MNAVVTSSFSEAIHVIVPISRSHQTASIIAAINVRLNDQGQPQIGQNDTTVTLNPNDTVIRYQYFGELVVKSPSGFHNHGQVVEQSYYTDDVDVFLGKREAILAQMSKNFINGLQSQIIGLQAPPVGMTAEQILADVNETITRFRDVFPSLENQALQ